MQAGDGTNNTITMLCVVCLDMFSARVFVLLTHVLTNIWGRLCNSVSSFLATHQFVSGALLVLEQSVVSC